jgi:ribosomal-protein-alanine N-acetyltransferase
VITASLAHAAVCAAIHLDAFPPIDAWNAQAFAELLAGPGVHGLIDARGGLVLVRQVADEAEILTLATAPALRRQGVARQLLAAALDWARVQGARTVFLEVSEANVPARALYAAAGFVGCGRRPRYYTDGSDALVLRLSGGGSE